MKTISIVVLVSIILFSCGSDPASEDNSQPIIIEDRIAFPDSAREAAFASFRPETQNFSVDASDDTLLVGKGGTTVFVAQNSFIGSDGKPVTGPIEIKMIEVLSANDIIRSNMQTVCDGQILESEGMLFIDAKANNQSVALGTDKTLSIELPTRRSKPGVKIFSGSYDSTGNITWTVSGKPENKMICLPLEMFDYSYWKSFDFKKEDYYHESWSYSVPDGSETVDSLNLKRAVLENTFIATREFESRFNMIQSAQWAIGHYTSFETSSAMTGRMIADSAVLNIYLNNLDKELWYCDSLAYAYIKSWSDKPTIRDWGKYGDGVGKPLLEIFQAFIDQRNTSCIAITSGVNLDASNAREQLQKSGKTDSEITEILNAYRVRKRLIAEKKDSDGTEKLVRNSFEVAKLGWINCDRFLNEPEAKDIELLTKISNSTEFKYVSLTLILNWRKLALNAYTTDDGQYRFGFQPVKTVRLPVGERATLIAVAYKDGIPYFVSKEIELAEKGDYELTLIKSTKESIDSTLRELN